MLASAAPPWGSASAFDVDAVKWMRSGDAVVTVATAYQTDPNANELANRLGEQLI